VTPDAESDATNVTLTESRLGRGHEALIADDAILDAFPYAAFDGGAWGYYAAATATDPADLSVIERDSRTGAPVAALIATEGQQGVDFFGRAATFELPRDLPLRSIPKVGREVAEKLRDRVLTAGHSLEVRVITGSAVLSGFEKVLLASGASVSLDFTAEVDLTLAEEGLWSSLRKSYRSLINAGRRDLSIECVDSKSADRLRFQIYRDLHREVAGRVTRPAESWEVMFEMVTQGRAQLVLAHLEGRPVAATFFMRFGKLALYASGAYARDLGKFPVSHWPLYASMLEAKRSGVERLVLGSVFLEADLESSRKERTIGAFKRGFATEVLVRRVYRFSSSV
jgi:hypothetical protein